MLLRVRCEKCGGQRYLDRDIQNGEVDDSCLHCGRLHGSYVRGADDDVRYIRPADVPALTIGPSRA